MRQKIQQLLSQHPEPPLADYERHFPRALFVGLAAMIAILTIYRLFDFTALSPSLRLLLGQVPFVVGGLGGAMLVLKNDIRKFGWRAVLAIPPASAEQRVSFWRRNSRLTCIMVLGSICISLITAALLKFFGWQYFPEQSIDALSKNSQWHFWPTAFFCSVVIAPVLEEILFRRLLFRSLWQAEFPAAALLTAVAFATLHALPQAIPAFIFVGLLLQLACRIGTLRQAIALHASYNIIMFWLLIFRKLILSA